MEAVETESAARSSGRAATEMRIVLRSVVLRKHFTPQWNRRLGHRIAVVERGWTARKWRCLNILWGVRESGWSSRAQNWEHRLAGRPIVKSAYGIPQALPAEKMETVAPDWRWNPRTQIIWGLNYIVGRYGTSCGALRHSTAYGWY